ncbi:MAG: glycosyltransferase family 2 protein [Candidatus Marinimicrobia bacterium]|nr:glycosyltransferase family 2 protein [Candidatus Neomarinimicrobiota bacterium]
MKQALYGFALRAARLAWRFGLVRGVVALAGRRSEWLRLLAVHLDDANRLSCGFAAYVAVERHLLKENRPIYVAALDELSWRPRFSIVVPVYNPDLTYLRRCLASVEGQIYPDWEICLVDDASTDSAVAAFLRAYAQGQSRVRVKFREENGHIAAATNDGLALAGGDFVALLDQDDELAADALYHVARRLNERPRTDVLYTDQDKLDGRGRRYEPFFKPDWSPAYLRGVMYFGHLLVVRRELLEAVGGCDPAYNGVQDYELALRLTERTDRIEHVARIAYHWRAGRGSIAASPTAKPDIARLQQRAVQAHLDRLKLPAQAEALPGTHRVRLVPRAAPAEAPVSVLICSRDAGEVVSRCLDSLFSLTRCRPAEVLLADNGTTDPIALAAFDRHPLRRIPMPEDFHFAGFNNRLAAAAQSEFLLFLNNDTEVLDPDWLEYLLFHARQADVGAVGPLLLYPDRTVQHAGVVLGPRGTADHLMRGFPEGIDGYNGSLVCDHEVTAVTAACLLVAADKFRRIGGFNPLFERHYEDLDLCLRLRAQGWRNVFAAGARLLHHESKSRGKTYSYTDRVLLLDTWEDVIRAGDPYYGPHFNPAHTDYQLWTEGLTR